MQQLSPTVRNEGTVSYVWPSVFAVAVVATAGGFSLASKPGHYREPSATARGFDHSLTVQREPSAVDAYGADMSVTQTVSENKSIASEVKAEAWADLADLPINWLRVRGEINEYANLEDGWKGLGSLKVSEAVSEAASFLAGRFALHMPDGPYPMVGADDDGDIVFTWNERSFIGNLAIKSNKHYSYYLKTDARVLKKARVPIYAEPPEELVQFISA